jgi:cytochrome b involved in lipid metabolism
MADDDYAEERNMNDTTMPPPPKSNATRTVTKSTGGTPVRNKVRLRKGFGLGDWHRLLKSSKDLAQRKGEGLRRIKWDEIKQHTAIYDGWTVLKGKVYFISPYLAYHPGGEAIMHKILGKDCTALFEKYHRWVNEDG